MKNSKRILFLITLILSVNLFAQDGTLDKTFGNNGEINYYAGADYISDIISLSNNKTLLLTKKSISQDIRTNAAQQCIFFKFDEDGSLYQTFGNNDILKLDTIDNNSMVCRYTNPRVYDNGKILLIQNKIKRTLLHYEDAIDSVCIQSENNILRINEDGSIDTNFGVNGFLNIYSWENVFSFNINKTPELYYLDIRSDGSFITALKNGISGYEIRCYNYNGSINETFGTNGKISVDNKPPIILDNEDNFYTLYDRIITKYNSIGNKIMSYGNSGKFDLSDACPTNYLSSFQQIDSKNNLFIDLNTDSTILSIIKITKNGELDYSFGSAGIKKIIGSDLNLDNNISLRHKSIKIAKDNSLICSAHTSINYPNFTDRVWTKFLPDGNFDISFSNNGYLLSSELELEKPLYDNSSSSFCIRKKDQKILYATLQSDTISLYIIKNSHTYSSTHVSGEVYDKWDVDTVFVDGDITIPKDSSLQINPGTHVYFTGKYTFNILGQLIANGTKNDSIFFFADSLGRDFNSPYYKPEGFWYGLGFKNTDDYNSPKSEISYCDFKYAHSRGWNTYWDQGFDKDVDSVGAPIRLYYSSNVSIKNIKISECNSSYFGTIQIIHSSPDIGYSDVGEIQITKNSQAKIHNLLMKGNYGKQIYIHNSNPILDSIIFEDSKQSALFGRGFGGKITNSIFRNNEFNWKEAGGAVSLVEGSTAIFNNVLFENNKQTYNQGWYGYGGAVFINDSHPEFKNCEFINNSATGGGGAVAVVSYAGPIEEYSVFENCLFVKNTVTMGPGTIVTGAKIKLINCTIADNTASYDAGISNDSGQPNIIKNNIVYNNGPDLNQQISLHRMSGEVVYNMIQGNYAGKDAATTNIHDVDPLFRDTSTNNYHLQNTDCGYTTNSLAIDAGDPNSTDMVLNCMQGLGTNRADMGCYGGQYTSPKGGNNLSLKINNTIIPLIYPNPATFAINIQLEIQVSEIQIFNQQGQLVIKSDNKRDINISILDNGIYIIRVIDNYGYIYNSKFIKK